MLMQKLIDYIKKLIPDFILSRAVSAIILFFLVRFGAIVYDAKSIGRALVRQEAAVMRWQLYFTFGLFFVALFFLQRLFNKTTTKNKVVLLSGYALFYCVIGILDTTIERFNYLYLTISNVGVFSELSSFMVLDLFFRPPYLFWIVLWFIVSPFIFRGKYGEKVLFIAWGAPIFLLGYNLRYVMFLNFFIVGIAAIIGAISKQKSITYKIPTFSFLFILTTIFGYLYTPFHESVSITSFIVLASFCWLFSILSICFLNKINTVESAAMSWFIPLFSSICLMLPVQGFLYGRSFTYTWTVTSSLHYMTAPMAFILILAVISTLIARKFTKISIVVFDSIAVFLIFFFVIDMIFYSKTGMHLDWMVVQWASAVNDLTVIWGAIAPAITIVNILTLLVLPIVYYGCLHYFRPKTTICIQNSNFRFLVLLSVLSSLVLFLPEMKNCVCENLRDPLVRLSMSCIHNLNMTKTDISAEQLVKRNKALGTEFTKIEKLKKNSYKPFNLIFVILESSHNRYLSLFGAEDETCPKLKMFENKMELFPNFYSNFQESGNGIIACLTSVFSPYKDLITFLNPRFSVKSLTEVLQDNGYDNYCFFSSYYECTNFSAFIRHRGFSKLYDMRNMPNITLNDKWIWGVKEYATVRNICKLIETKSKTAGEKPFSAIYVPVFPHEPYIAQQGGFSKFNRKEYVASGSKLGFYKNSLLYMDTQLAKILNKLEETGLDKQTIVALVSDHGNSVGEKGRFGHGWHLEPVLTNVPFIIIDPRTASKTVNPVLGSQVDILPTLLHTLGIDVPDGELYQGRDLHTIKGIRKDPVYLSSFKDMAVVKDKKYYRFRSGKIEDYEVFDIKVDTTIPKTTFINIENPDKKQAEVMLENCQEVFKNQKALIKNYGSYQIKIRGKQSKQQ